MQCIKNCQQNDRYSLSGSQIVDVSHITELILGQGPNINYDFVFQIAGRKISEFITIFFWKGKVTSPTNLRDLVTPLAAANSTDLKVPSRNWMSINVLIIQQISPYHKQWVNIILYRFVHNI